MTELSAFAGDLPPRRDPQENEDPWWQWPRCPTCGRRRQTRCATCDLDSDDFPLAEFIPAAEPLPVAGAAEPPTGDLPAADDPGVLLMCPVCDEAFAPTFYRLCQQCGHDFGSGWLIDASTAEPLGRRVLLVLAGLAVLSVVVLVYLWLLFA